MRLPRGGRFASAGPFARVVHPRGPAGPPHRGPVWAQPVLDRGAEPVGRVAPRPGDRPRRRGRAPRPEGRCKAQGQASGARLRPLGQVGGGAPPDGVDGGASELRDNHGGTPAEARWSAPLDCSLPGSRPMPRLRPSGRGSSTASRPRRPAVIKPLSPDLRAAFQPRPFNAASDGPRRPAAGSFLVSRLTAPSTPTEETRPGEGRLPRPATTREFG